MSKFFDFNDMFDSMICTKSFFDAFDEAFETAFNKAVVIDKTNDECKEEWKGDVKSVVVDADGKKTEKCKHVEADNEKSFCKQFDSAIDEVFKDKQESICDNESKKNDEYCIDSKISSLEEQIKELNEKLSKINNENKALKEKNDSLNDKINKFKSILD